MQLDRIGLILAMAAIAAACGQKGPLVLPDRHTHKPVASPAPQAPAPAAQPPSPNPPGDAAPASAPPK